MPAKPTTRRPNAVRPSPDRLLAAAKMLAKVAPYTQHEKQSAALVSDWLEGLAKGEIDLLTTFKSRLDTRMNDHLAEMKPDYDDSIVGFNEAWDVVRKLFEDMQNGK